ncbi:MAG: DUF3857 and transglutaminase domain-containing protein [Moheibacter sp.]
MTDQLPFVLIQKIKNKSKPILVKKYLTFLFMLYTFIVFAQSFDVNSISEKLTENAYAVVRMENSIVEFSAKNEMKYSEEFAITILNESGRKYAYYPINYDKTRKINLFDATLYNANGKEIRKLKKRDLKDVSAVDGFSLYLDDRIQYYNFTPVSYPFTIHYKIEISSSNTISLPGWQPVSNYDLGIENSQFTLINHTSIPIRKLEESFDGWNVKKSESENTLSYSIQNIPPIQDEILSPPLRKVSPNVRFAPTEFEFEGIKGNFENWEQFGKWYYDNLLKDKNDLAEEEKQTVLQLVDGITNPIEKIRILYQYMQSKTRYINIAIGIGGWEPYPASYVSSKSYGDCKALSNYMVSLLETIGIDAFHTIVYGENSRKVDMEKNFASLQGNHMIVGVPLESETIWLECTNQQTAFNYLGQFTDDRFAILITPEGGKVVTTQNFPLETNKEIINGTGELLPNGNLKANFTIEDSGLQYDLAYNLNFENTQEQKRLLNSLFGRLPNFQLKSYELVNDRDNAVFTTKAVIESTHFAKTIGDNITLNVVPFERTSTALKKDNNRQYPFEIRFGYTDETRFELKLPNGYKLSETFQPKIYIDDFGSYLLTVKDLESGILQINRKLVVKDGNYPKEKFNDYVEFRRRVSSMDNSKVLLEKI